VSLTIPELLFVLKTIGDIEIIHNERWGSVDVQKKKLQNQKRNYRKKGQKVRMLFLFLFPDVCFLEHHEITS
jgi:hypothetical protein